MKFRNYLKDKLYLIFLFFFIYISIILMMVAFKVDKSLMIVISILLFLFFLLDLFIDYFRKRKFYTDFLGNVEALDKAYLVLETIDSPTFYEGELTTNAFYQINKSYMESIAVLESAMNDFKEYIEMWIHEVKLPLSSLTLIAHNNKNKFDKKTMEQLKKLEDYVEQVLYYVRSENAEKDYLVNKVNLSKVIGNVALKNKNDLLLNEIEFKVHDINVCVHTDSKWLEFIINQIVSNSIKYKVSRNDSWIEIYAAEDNDNIKIIIKDNGIGISKADLPRVFDKTFTGSNGHMHSKSTGMGLYISKNLCTKLGHKLEIESKVNEYTKVIITISKNNYYDVLDPE